MTETRIYWLNALTRLAEPVLEAGAARQLCQTLPAAGREAVQRTPYARLEAVARLLCGMAPWLESHPVDAHEAALHKHLGQLARQTVESLTDPKSPDYAIFYEEMPFSQSLVDAAFLAQAVLRAPRALFEELSPTGQKNLLAALQASRKNRPAHNNWLLFSAMVEACLYRLTGQCDLMRVDYALAQHEQWYRGDGAYGDGPGFHHDYYNSFVIHPMVVEIRTQLAACFTENQQEGARQLETARLRLARYAAVLEKNVAPDGSFPAVGRSITYRTGAFHALALAALLQLPLTECSPAQVRGALTAVMHRCLDDERNYLPGGWLRIGLCGAQPGAGEGYISTGSLYLCSTAFLPLGLPEDAPFWQLPQEPYSAQKIWGGMDFEADHACPI